MLKYGHGYDNPTLPGRTPCTAFVGFHPIAAPLGGFSDADRERRVFPSASQRMGVTYGSHAVKLGRADNAQRGDTEHRTHGTLAVMMEHGGGRQLTTLRICQKRAEIEAGLIAMGEAPLYFLLYAISEAADEARREAIRETDSKWRQALADGRVKKRRAKAGRAAFFDILEDWELPKRKVA
jgi:hypothetical protein